MDKQAIIDEFESIIRDYLALRSLDLVEFIHRHEGRNLVLMIFVDKPQGGITLDECAELNQEIGRILEERQMLHCSYILEVSSPGLDRPLKTKSDFARCLNKKVRLFFIEPLDGKLELEGITSQVSQESVHIDQAGMQTEIPLAKIKKGKQIIE
ncbi:ribosome maturation factor RimP [bacterium]|nr:MAG: ribosome maturation factor RimP [bacterium]